MRSQNAVPRARLRGVGGVLGDRHAKNERIFCNRQMLHRGFGTWVTGIFEKFFRSSIYVDDGDDLFDSILAISGYTVKEGHSRVSLSEQLQEERRFVSAPEVSGNSGYANTLDTVVLCTPPLVV